MCREPLDLNLDWLAQAKAPSGEKFTYQPTKEMRELQKKMAAMFSRQKDKGAIIDVEAERNKFLISADEVVTVSRKFVQGLYLDFGAGVPQWPS